ncbi:SIR2 family protein [Companilactobacillus sp. HBUAS56275]|uniref:SIR2 family protein n=1 Tax=Candidatus Companilactobacillus pullicola TaxID=2838523 RepID=A0A9D1ZNG9_9LACO|nr:SIR2 family protein [Candidatus Companilactobacillus pullicola]
MESDGKKNINDEDEYSEFISDIRNSENNNSLFFFVGAGVSISQGYPTWNDYVSQLIEYWKYHLSELYKKDIANGSNTKKISFKQLELLDELKKSSMSNKRKVDFIDTLIRNICDEVSNSDTQISEQYYRSAALGFEKFLFLNVEPIKIVNDILNELLNIRSTFITTNYDSQIEGCYREKFGIKPEVIMDFHDDFTKENVHKVIHLHGTPLSNPQYFINSSEGYSKIYYDSLDKYKEKIAELFKQKVNPIIIFIGCSMEEDEVLSLFDLKNKKYKYYSLMKYDKKTPELSKFTKEYYECSKNIKYIWYGNEYGDLPIFIRQMLEDKDSRVMDSMTPKDMENILIGENMVDKTSFVSVINKQLSIGNSHVLDSAFSKYDSLDSNRVMRNINMSFESSLINKDFYSVTAYIPNYWKQIDKYFNELDINGKSIVIDYLEDYSINGFSLSEYMISILLNNSSQKGEDFRIDYYEKFLRGIYSNEYYDFRVESQDLNALWLIDHVSKNHSVYLGFIDKQTFGFNETLFEKLIQNLDSMDKTLMLYDYRYLIDETGVGLLKYLIEKDKLNLTDGQLLRFKKAKIVQRIYCNLILNGFRVPKETRDEIVRNISETYKFYGKEMNIFLSKYKKNYDKKSDFYIDGIYSDSKLTINEYNNFLPIRISKSNEEIDRLISKLKEVTFKSNADIQIDIMDQDNEIDKSLSNSKIWIENKDGVIYFLNGLINDDELRKTYRRSIMKSVIYGYSTDHIKPEFINNYFDIEKSNNKDIFDFLDEELFTEIIKKEDFDKIEGRFMSFKMNELNTKNNNTDIIENGNINLDEFINTDLGHYTQIIKQISTDDLKRNETLIKSKIGSVDNKYRPYLKGMFIELFDDEIDFESINTFLGFSHNYRFVLNGEYVRKFSNLVRNCFFENKIRDNFTIYNMSIALVENIDPLENNQHIVTLNKKQSEFDEQIFKRILNLFFKKKIKSKFKGNWVEFFLRECGYTQSLINFIIYSANDIDISNLRILKDLLKQNMNKELSKVRSTSFYSIQNMNLLDVEKIDIIIDLLEILLQENVMKEDTYFMSSMNSFLKTLKSDSLDKQINNVIDILTRFVPSSEIEELKREYL